MPFFLVCHDLYFCIKGRRNYSSYLEFGGKFFGGKLGYYFIRNQKGYSYSLNPKIRFHSSTIFQLKVGLNWLTIGPFLGKL